MFQIKYDYYLSDSTEEILRDYKKGIDIAAGFSDVSKIDQANL